MQQTAGQVDALADDELVGLLRLRDEAAYGALVRRYTPLMLSLARAHLPDPAAAEEVVQDTWLAVVAGIDGFEGRATLRTWLLRILRNIARARGGSERRCEPWSSVPGDVGRWERLLPVTPDDPSRLALQRATLAVLGGVVETLPERQREVFVLRDVLGRSSAEVSARLGVSGDHQRVLLHRARSRLRAAAGAGPGRAASASS